MQIIYVGALDERVGRLGVGFCRPPALRCALKCVDRELRLGEVGGLARLERACAADPQVLFERVGREEEQGARLQRDREEEHLLRQVLVKICLALELVLEGLRLDERVRDADDLAELALGGRRLRRRLLVLPVHGERAANAARDQLHEDHVRLALSALVELAHHAALQHEAHRLLQEGLVVAKRALRL